MNGKPVCLVCREKATHVVKHPGRQREVWSRKFYCEKHVPQGGEKISK